MHKVHGRDHLLRHTPMVMDGANCRHQTIRSRLSGELGGCVSDNPRVRLKQKLADVLFFSYAFN